MKKQSFSRRIVAVRLLGASLIVVVATLLFVRTVSNSDQGGDRVGVQTSLSPATTNTRKPSRRDLVNWIKTSSDSLAARAEDHQWDEPRRRGKNGETLPFREVEADERQVAKLRGAQPGSLIRIDLFPGVRFDLLVKSRSSEQSETKVFASVPGRPPRDQFSMSWMNGSARGLLELPSENRSYELLLSESGRYVVREWLYSDLVCARSSSASPQDSADAGMPPAPAAGTALAPVGLVPRSNVPSLNSRPSAPATIYLDFDGETVSGTSWAGGATINALPARMDAAQIEETWRRVSNHFAVFDVNVTTDRAVYDAAPATRKTHCVVTPTTDAAPGAGGVAYLDSFTNPSTLTKVCWTFVDDRPDYAALVCSHEVGHTLGLRHHGRVASGSLAREEYYLGHGSGETGWGPFMGAPYGKNLLQWSKGEYARANNSAQDDLAVVSTPALIPFLADDHGNTDVASTALTSGVVASGMIEQNTDVDFFSYQIAAGGQPVEIQLQLGTMLDAQFEVFYADGSPVGTVNPPEQLPAKITVLLPTPQKVYIKVSGIGKSDVLGTGYSNYSSLGSYTIVAGDPLPLLVTGLAGEGISDSAIQLTWSPAQSASSYRIYRNGTEVGSSAFPSFRDSGLRESSPYTYTVRSVNAAGESGLSQSVTATTLSWVQANPYRLRITDPAAIAASPSANYVFRGIAGSRLSSIAWSNSATGLTGSFTLTNTSWQVSIPLSAGTNRVAFMSTYRESVATNFTAYDNPSDGAYASGWSNGFKGGVGFGAWHLQSIGSGALFLRTDKAAETNATTSSLNAWGLLASNGSTAVAGRDLPVVFSPDRELELNLDWGSVLAGRSTGWALTDATGATRLNFRASGGSADFLVSDSGGERNTGVAVNADGHKLRLSLDSLQRYRLIIGTNVITGELAQGSDPTRLVFSNRSISPGGGGEFYIGPMMVRTFAFTNRTVRVVAPAVIFDPGSSGAGNSQIPAEWWTAHFGVATGVSPEMDSDSDGLNNGLEYAAGTDPNDARSALRITSMREEIGGVRIAWESVPGKSYHVETRKSLAAGGWDVALSNVPAALHTNQTSALVPRGGVEQFYRVRLAP